MLFPSLCVALFATLASAQTTTKCNPLAVTCPADPALGTTFNQTYGTTSSVDTDYWSILAGPEPMGGTAGFSFTINQHGDSPTLQTNFYMFFGSVEVLMQAAPGQGIISSIVLLSDDLDEIDWEIKGGNTSSVSTNYYGKGNQSESNAIYYPVASPQTGFHNYTTVWNAQQLEWHVDGNLLRTLQFGDAVFNGKSSYPQTPMHLKIGNWAGGDPSEPPGVISWAGGQTDYSDGPFTMLVKSVKVVDGHTNATQYIYGDHSGSWQSIEVTEGVSSVSQKINAPPPLTITQRWNKLSSGTRIVIIAVIAAVVSFMLGLLTLCCIKQRRAGRRERALADAAWEKETMELAYYRQQMNSGAFAKGSPLVHQQSY